MAEKLSQEELEKPVKRYQIEALSDKFDVMNKSFEEKLTVIIKQTSDLVTKEQLKIEVGIINRRIDEEIVSVKKETRKVFWIVFAAVIALAGNLIIGLFKLK